jgi:DNA-binding transcriptional MerR regulator
VSSSAQFLSPSEAAKRLGVSAKALRLYEQRGLVVPGRTASGWRAYGPDEMARAAEIAALRTLGLSLAQVARVMKGDVEDLEPAPGRAPSDTRKSGPPSRRCRREGARPAGRSRPRPGARPRKTGAPA